MDEMYDEAIDVVDAEDVPSMSSRSKSPESSRANMKTPRPQSESRLGMVLRAGEQLMTEGHMRQRRVATIDSDMSDNTDEQEDDDDDIVQAPIIEGAYDPKDYEHLPVSSEVKELFQYITFYTPQTVQLDYKLEPFVPDYIPSVGEIDDFVKVPRPDGVDDKLGLVVLDEPCADQTEPAVMHLQLRASAKQSSAKPIVVKQVEDPVKNPKAIEKWIKDIQELHRSKPPPAVHYSNLMPDIDNLMEAWPPDFEQKLNQLGLPLESLETDLPTYIDIILALFDIPKYGSRIESLHVLFTLYSAIKNYKNEEREAAVTPNP